MTTTALARQKPHPPKKDEPLTHHHHQHPHPQKQKPHPHPPQKQKQEQEQEQEPQQPQQRTGQQLVQTWSIVSYGRGSVQK